MGVLSGAALLRVWEEGEAQHPLDRALTLLAVAHPGATRAELAALPVSERDRRLLLARAAELGPALAVFTACPACGERLEFTVDTGELVEPGEPGTDREWEMEEGGFTLRFRLPDSRDLAAAARAPGVDEARRLLAARCVLQARDARGPMAPDALPEPALRALAARMAQVAPGMELSFALVCPECGAPHETALDVPAFVWAELADRAGRLLREVFALARSCHFSEAEILAMPPRRRRAYLELADA